MQGTTVAIRYATALFQLALEKNKSKEVLDDLKLVSEFINKERQLANLINNPTIKKNIKESVFKKLFGEKVNSITIRFMVLAINKGREAVLFDVFQKYEEIYNKQNNISVVEVVSATPLNESLREIIKEKTSFSGRKAQLIEKVDNSLMGGLIIKKGDLQYDSSIRKKLNNAKRAFKL